MYDIYMETNNTPPTWQRTPHQIRKTLRGVEIARQVASESFLNTDPAGLADILEGSRGPRWRDSAWRYLDAMTRRVYPTHTMYGYENYADIIHLLRNPPIVPADPFEGLTE